MTPEFEDDWLTVYGGDCRTVLRELPAESVHCVITSPPYWGLRDYGTATWEGGDEGCDHRGRPSGSVGSSAKSTLTTASRKGDWAPGNVVQTIGRGDCHCGARRIDSQLGLEQTPDEYVAAMVDVFREVRRVLRSDGTVWLNLGDSYATGAGSVGNRPGGGAQGDNWHGAMTSPNRMPLPGLKPKDLVGIPWRVAFALQADGWYLRSDIIWSKPNPMPESVTDRPTKSHEYLFLLAKSARYYFDADAVREPSWDQRPDYQKRYAAQIAQHQRRQPKLTGNGVTASVKGGRPYADEKFSHNPAGRNIRSVWTIATAPYPGAHFATFPPKLVEPCVKAGTSERGVCPECGAPWQRVVERAVEFTSGSGRAGRPPNGKNGTDYEQATSGTYDVRMGPSVRSATTGWRPTCRHEREPVPAVLLDCFAGTGTVGLVAQSLSRRAVLIDLNPDYLRQCLARNAQTPLGLMG